MTNATIILALKSALGLVFIWLFVFFLWKDYCLDMLREDIFCIRDELFMYAAEGNLHFESSAYILLRSRLNLSLRYAHEFTLARFALAMAVPLGNPESEAWKKALESVSPRVQSKLNEYRNAFVFGVLKYMTLRSFFLYLVVLLFWVVGGLRRVARRYAFPRVIAGVERLETEALQEEAATHASEDPVVVGVG